MQAAQLLNRLETWCVVLVRKLSPRRVRWLLDSVLIIWLLYGLARLAWLFMVAQPVDISAALPAPSMIAQPIAAAVDIAQLQTLHLFGARHAAESAELPRLSVDVIEANAQKTSLALELQGTVYSQQPSESVAIIRIDGQSAVYRVGDRLPFSHKVTLVKIRVDHIILDNNGRYESVWLFNDEDDTLGRRATASSVKPVAKNTVVDWRNQANITAMARSYRDQMYRDPQSLVDVIKITPVRRDGVIVGYQLVPGRDAEQFAELGFHPGDLVTHINDTALSDPAQMLELYRLMRTAQEAIFTVDRNGQMVQILVAF